MTPEPATTDRPLRRDAERNRERILEAARAAFAEDGLDVGLHEIAKRAGLGVGTVYRRFPDKQTLVEALYEDRIDEVVAIAEESLREDDAWTGLSSFLHRTCELQAHNRALHQLVFSSVSGVKFASKGRERIAPLVGQLVARAQEQGTMRPDVAVFDVGMLRNTLGLFIDQTGEAGAEVWPRLLAVMLDGLRAGSERSELPGATPTPEVFERLLQRRRC
jgi:AcrR family transcriptional regulator